MLDSLSVLAARIMGWFSSRRLDAEFDEELETHRAMLTDEYVGRGMNPAVAARSARLRLGAGTQLRERAHRQRGLPFLDSLGQDVRYAFRAFAGSPKFTATAVFILIIGIGVNTIAFTVLDAALFKPLPVADPYSLVRIERWFDSGARGDVNYGFSYDEYRHLRTHARLLAIVAAGWPSRVSSDGDVLHVQPVSEDYFSRLGVTPVLGRSFLAEENGEPGAHPVAVVSDRLWRRKFAGDQAITGRTVRLNGIAFTIVGVAPPGFSGTGNTHDVPDLWVPLAMQPQLNPYASWLDRADIHRLQLLGRPAGGASQQEARGELQVLASQVAEQTETGRPHDRTIAITLQRATYFGGTDDWRFQAGVGVLFALVALVLLVACANLANMLFARGMSRQKEIGIRLALGASRMRIVRQLLVENLCLAGLGGATGLLITIWAARVLSAEMDRLARILFEQPFGASLTPDFRVFAFGALVSMAAGVIFGISPALQLTSEHPGAVLRDDSRTFGQPRAQSRLRDWLLAAQVSVSMLFLVCAGLLVRGVMRSESADPGFDTRHVFMADIHYSPDPAAAPVLQRRILDRLNASGGVENAALVDRYPFSGTWSPPVVIEGAAGSAQTVTRTLANYVSGRYFETLGIRLLRGRVFTDRESQSGASIAIVSASAARRFWPAEDPLGQFVRVDLHFDHRFVAFEVVGVVEDVRSGNISRIDPAYVYLPTRATTVYNVVVRSNTDAAATRAAVRDAITPLDAAAARTAGLTSIQDGPALRTQLTTSRLLAVIASTLAGVALLLATTGIYAVTAYYVGRRTREIGMRMALGADAGAVRRAVMRESITPAIAGGLVGLLASTGVATILRSMLVAPSSPDLLFGIGAFDPVAFVGVPLFLTAVAALASYVPSRRASRVDPLIALRTE